MRTVPSSVAVSGMTLVVVPALMWATVSTAGSNALTRRVTIVCSAPTIAAAAGTGSSASCGAEACPPRPVTVTWRSSDDAMIESGRVWSVPAARRDVTCRAIADSGVPPGPSAESSPSAIIMRAPWELSSPGWNMRTTVPARRVAPSGEQPGGGRQHRGVQVVPAGVHGAVDLGGERQPGVLVHRQRVHVRAHEHRRSRPRTAQDGDDRAALPAGVDLERQVLERGEHGGLGDGQRQADLGVTVQGAPQLQRPWLQGAGLGQQGALRGTVRRAAPARSPLRSAHPSDPGTPTVKSPHPGSPTGVPPDGRRPCADDRPALP